MNLPSSPDHRLTLPAIECGLTLIAVALPFLLPTFASSFFSRIERVFGRLARRKGLAVFATGMASLLLRLAILPAFPIPLPFVPDDFSFLLAADTFAHGRLTNPTPAMWMHFESLHISLAPTYMSMYFPANGLLLAAGKVVFGQPWFGILICSAMMSAAICWMLQAWLPPTWALLGGAISILHIGLFSYWINTYTGGGVICALGGALILGALPRLKRTAHFRYGLLIAIGIVLLVLTRPYEGMLLCLPVAASMAIWAVQGKNRPAPRVLLARAIVPLALVAAAFVWLGYYDQQNFGKVSTLPYTVNRATYAMAPYFVWQNARPEPAYHHASMRRFYYESELKIFNQAHQLKNYLPVSGIKILSTLLFFAGVALFPPVLMMREVFKDRRMRFLFITLLCMTAGMAIQIYLIPHYLAAFTALFYALGLQAMRHLRLWKYNRQAAGTTMVRLLVTVCVVMSVLRVFAGPLNFKLVEWPASSWCAYWYGPGHFGTERATIAAGLEHQDGKQLVLVRASDNRDVLDEWVYNSADIDSSKVIWARDMDRLHNAELINHYKDRKVWLVQLNTYPATVKPYSAEDKDLSSLPQSELALSKPLSSRETLP